MSLWQTVSITLGLGCLAGGAWVLWRRWPADAKLSGVPGQAALPQGALRVLPAESLLQPHASLVTEITRVVGLPTPVWNSLGDPLLTRFAEFCQRMPASEAHHHAHPGGLLEHTLDVAVRALRLRQGLMLPPGADAEDISRLKSRWSYAVLAAALLHDIGNPLASVLGIDLSGQAIAHHERLKSAHKLHNLDLLRVAVEDVATLGREFASGVGWRLSSLVNMVQIGSSLGWCERMRPTRC